MSSEERPVKCEVCDEDFVGTWTDFYGEATCWNCGVPYQILEPSGAEPGGTYPHIKIKAEWIPIFREYWQKTRRRNRHGFFVTHSDRAGVVEEGKAFNDWLRTNHPELIPAEKKETDKDEQRT